MVDQREAYAVYSVVRNIVNKLVKEMHNRGMAISGILLFFYVASCCK